MPSNFVLLSHYRTCTWNSSSHIHQMTVPPTRTPCWRQTHKSEEFLDNLERAPCCTDEKYMCQTCCFHLNACISVSSASALIELTFLTGTLCPWLCLMFNSTCICDLRKGKYLLPKQEKMKHNLQFNLVWMTLGFLCDRVQCPIWRVVDNGHWGVGIKESGDVNIFKVSSDN